MPKAKRIEDMSEDELSERSRKAYDKAMPEPDTTFGDLAKRMPKHDLPQMQNLPDTSAAGSSLKDFVNRKSKPRKDLEMTPMKKGGMTASARADGIAQRGKTRGTIVACGGGRMKGK